MAQICPHCHSQQSQDNRICEVCGWELIDNGQLFDALDFYSKKRRPVIIQNLMPLGIIILSGIASAALNILWILGAGFVIAAAVYYKLSR